MKILIGLAIVALSWFIISLINASIAAGRAYSRRPTHYKHGMVFHTKQKRIIGTTTPVYTDPKTGSQFLGKTEEDII